MVGFEELGNTDTFRRDLLEDRLGASGEFLRSLFEERVRADHGLDSSLLRRHYTEIKVKSTEAHLRIYTASYGKPRCFRRLGLVQTMGIIET